MEHGNVVGVGSIGIISDLLERRGSTRRSLSLSTWRPTFECQMPRIGICEAHLQRASPTETWAATEGKGLFGSMK